MTEAADTDDTNSGGGVGAKGTQSVEDCCSTAVLFIVSKSVYDTGRTQGGGSVSERRTNGAAYCLGIDSGILKM